MGESVRVLPRPVRQFRRTTLVTSGLTCFLIGLALAHTGLSLSFGIAVVVVICCVPLLRKRRVRSIVACVICGFVAGLCWGGHYYQKLAPYRDTYDSKVTLQVVANEDAVYGKNSQLSFEAVQVVVLEPKHGVLPGRLKIAGFGENMVYRGDTLEVTGKLRSTLGGRQGQMSYAKLKVVQRGDGFISKVRRNFTTGMLNALPEPMASFGAGLLIGQRATLPDAVNKELSAVGLTHLVAVSGYNLTIIVLAVRRLTAKRSKYQSLVLSLMLVGLFLLVTGLSPSIVRAALVSVFTLWAWYYGRVWRPWLLIVFSAAITAGWNPLYLWGDIGWYLSFLAFFGVLILAPALTRRIYGERQPKFLHAVLIETFCAQIMTLPLILYIFSQVSFIAIISNLLVVPLVPLAMLVSLVAGLGGMFFPAVAGWVAWPARILLTYMLDVSRVLSHVPHAVGRFALPSVGLIWLYAVELFWTVVLWRKTRPKYGIVTDREVGL